MTLLLVLSSLAQASGFYFSDAGVRALGRGTAVVAGADDPMTAQYYNPATLIRMKGGHAKFDLAMVGQMVEFQRAPTDDESFDLVVNDAPYYKIPSFGVSHDFGTERFVFALGFYPPYAPKLLYPDDGPQRYSLVTSTIIQTTAGPSMAVRLHDWVSLGVGLQWHLMFTEYQLFVTTLEGDDPADQIGFGLGVMDPASFMANGGVLIEPPSGKFAVSVGVQPPVSFAAEGWMEADFSNHRFYEQGIITGAVARDEDITLNITMPLMIKTGVLVRPIEGLEVEAGLIYQRWSTMQAIKVTDLDLAVETEPDNPLVPEPIVITDDVELPAGYADAYSVRLGGEYKLTDRVSGRLGGMYETSAIPGASQTVALVDGDKLGYGVGATVWLPKGFAVDVALAQSFFKEREVTDSDSAQILVDVLSAEVSEGLTVGNGTYRSRGDFFGVGVEYVWGQD